jgi:hypothetical protein
VKTPRRLLRTPLVLHRRTEDLTGPTPSTTVVLDPARGAIFPGGTTENLADGQTVEADATLFVGPEVDLEAIDAVTGPDGTYELDGAVATWRHPRRPGRVVYRTVPLKRRT